MELVITTPRFLIWQPAIGETIPGSDFMTAQGDKGAIQQIAPFYKPFYKITQISLAKIT